MLRRHLFLGSLLSFVALTAETEAGAPAAEEPKANKSIVPNKYGDKYKGGGSDALAEFINTQAKGKDGFEYPAFFQLCKLNGLDEAKVDHYAGQVAEKRHGAQGRARMTLRNMLATLVRKNGKLVGLDGTEHELSLPKPAVTGAAAKAQEASAETETKGDENSSETEQTAA